MRRPEEARTPGGLLVDRYVHTAPASSVVIVHGVMDRAAGWRRVIRHLDRHEVLAYDRRGYHRNLDQAWTGDRLVADIADLVDVARLARSPHVTVVGHSQGALIALHAARETAPDPPFSALLLWEPPMPWEDWYDGGWGWSTLESPPEQAAEFFLRGVLGDDVWERLPPAAREERRSEGAALRADLLASRTPQGRLLAGSVGVAVVVGAGGRSAPHNRRTADVTAAMIPDAARVTIDDAAHGVQLDAPAALAAVIDEAAARPTPD